MIEAGRVTVDGAPAHLGQQTDPATADIRIDGVPLPVAPGLASYLVYKPQGVVTTTSDPQGRPIVTDLVSDEARIYPVGRLDTDSEGLIILTNDGELALRLTHPRYGVHKTYVALVDGLVDAATLRRLTDGVMLDDGPAAAVSTKVVDRYQDASIVEVVMGEGRNRIVRRMLAAVGHPVQRLTRTAIGPLSDRRLAPGSSRPLTIVEIRDLYAAAGDDGHA
ncbi:MAG: pseudouridine synthase [Acidimicrobiia bacterium]|nr:MAG: pseudouridine synthase [Acidimicrobiia bacterium]